MIQQILTYDLNNTDLTAMNIKCIQVVVYITLVLVTLSTNMRHHRVSIVEHFRMYFAPRSFPEHLCKCFKTVATPLITEMLHLHEVRDLLSLFPIFFLPPSFFSLALLNSIQVHFN